VAERRRRADTRAQIHLKFASVDHKFRCCVSDAWAIGTTFDIVRMPNADLRWKSRRISSTPSGQSFVSGSVAFANRQLRRPPATNTTQPYPASPTFRSLFESKVGLCQAESNNCVCARTLVLTAAMCQGRALRALGDLSHLLCPYLSRAIVRFGSISRE
jgi:hypothetical protein